MNERRYWHEICWVGLIWVFGGMIRGRSFPGVEKYDLQANTWTEAKPLPLAMENITVTYFPSSSQETDGVKFFFTGWDKDYIFTMNSVTEVYDVLNVKLHEDSYKQRLFTWGENLVLIQQTHSLLIS
jgi:hypothetical protein